MLRQRMKFMFTFFGPPGMADLKSVCRHLTEPTQSLPKKIIAILAKQIQIQSKI